MVSNIPLVVLLSLSAASLVAQSRVVQDDEWCDDGWYGDRDRVLYCEVRERTLSARSQLSIDGRANGGITVRAWDQNEILVRAKVQTHGRTEDAARNLASEVEVHADASGIRADGPHIDRDGRWVVSYRVFVPPRTNLALETRNGGVGIYGVNGRIEFEATNGGVHLEGVGGDVRGRTTNGGLHVELTGQEWQGDGMDVRTTNGGVRIVIPEGYSARLETGTTNGGLRIDFPITVQGRIDRRIATDLGAGGKLVRATTTNGGVVVTKR